MSKNKSKRFKDEYSFETRKQEAIRVRTKYPDRIPVIVEPGNNSNLPMIDKKKYLVPYDLSMSQFMWVIRRRIKLEPHQALFLFVNHNGKYILPPAHALVAQIYKEYADPQEFMFFEYYSENSFGG